MRGRNGLGQLAAAWIAEHPGTTYASVGEALAFNHNSGLLSYLVSTGRAFVSGQRGSYRLYATREEAEANHAQFFAEAAQRRLDVKKKHWRLRNQRLLAERKELRSKPKPAPVVVRVRNGVRITVAHTPPPRFAPSPGFERAISNDWILRRQGVDIRDHIKQAVFSYAEAA